MTATLKAEPASKKTYPFTIEGCMEHGMAGEEKWRKKKEARRLEIANSPENQNEIRRMQVRFERWLPVLLSSRTGRVVKQLERSKAMALCKQFIADHFDAIEKAKAGKSTSLLRFLAGEFTGGIVPIFIAKLVRGDVEQVVEAATIIEVMAQKYDRREWIAPEQVGAIMGMPVVASEAVPANTIVMVPQQTADQAQRGEIPTPIVIADVSPDHSGEVQEITPAQQAKLDSKVSALPPPMRRGGHARKRR